MRTSYTIIYDLVGFIPLIDYYSLANIKRFTNYLYFSLKNSSLLIEKKPAMKI